MKTFYHILFLLVFGTLCSAQETLGYTLNKDDVFVIKQDAQQLITQTMNGAAHEITNNITGVLEFKVLEAQEDTYQIAMRFKDLNLKMSSSIQGELMNVNAQEVTEGDLQSKIFNSLLDIPVEITLAKSGDIVNISGGDSLIIKMAEASGIEDAFQMNIMKKSLEKDFGSEALSNSYKQMTFIYPEKKVNIGDTWENEYFGKLNAKNLWTLKALADDSATINGTASIIMKTEDEATNMNLNGTQQTTITTDRSSGFVRSMTVTGEAEGITTMQQLGNTEIPTTILSTITYELINE